MIYCYSDLILERDKHYLIQFKIEETSDNGGTELEDLFCSAQQPPAFFIGLMNDALKD